MVARVLNAVAPLADQRALDRPGKVASTRELMVPKTRYLMPYRVNGETAEILRVFHASRRPPQRW